MGFINAALDDVQEDKAVPEGEYDLRITDVKEGKTKKGQDMVTCMVKIEGSEGEGAQPIFVNLLFNSDNPQAARLQALDVKRFLAAFNIPHDSRGFNTEDLQGATANCFVAQEEDQQGNIRNVLKPPRLRDDD